MDGLTLTLTFSIERRVQHLRVFLSVQLTQFEGRRFFNLLLRVETRDSNWLHIRSEWDKFLLNRREHNQSKCFIQDINLLHRIILKQQRRDKGCTEMKKWPTCSQPMPSCPANHLTPWLLNHQKPFPASAEAPIPLNGEEAKKERRW